MSEVADPYSENAIAVFRNQIEPSHNEILSIAQDCYAKLCEELDGAQYREGSALEMTFAISARILELSAISLLCMRSGSVPSAKILMRSALEATYKVCAIAHDPKNMRQYINDDCASQLVFRKQVHHWKQKKGNKSFAKGNEIKIDELVAQKASKIKPEEWAARAKMDDFHKLFYSYLNADTQGNASSIDPYFDTQRDFALTIGPSDIDLPITALILSRCLVNVLLGLGKLAEWDLATWRDATELRLGKFEERKTSADA